jgi:hypothetical protein
MSNTRYIEFDSTYRNRNEWPQPGEFEVLISQSGRKGQRDAVDPVSLAAPLNNFVWLSNDFDANAHAATVSTIVTAIQPGIGGAGDNTTTIEVTAAANTLQTIENYYRGAVAEDVTAPIGASRIVEYKYLGNNRAQLTVSGLTTVASGDTIQIHDPTDISDPTNPFFFVPTGRIGANGYTGCILYNISQNEWVNIIDYNTITRLLKTEDITLLGWTLTDIYTIRKEAPIVFGTVNNNVASSYNVSIPITNSSAITNKYQSGFLRINISGAGGPAGETRRITKYETFSDLATGGSLTTIEFPTGASSLPGYYNGMFIQITGGVATGDTRQIISYIPATTTTNAVATVNAAFTGAIVSGDSFAFRNLTTFPFSVPVQPADIFEIEQFSYDNLNPFVYTGSIVSQQEMVCYEIELLNLSLPNKTLNTGVGSRIAFYPYVYVEIANVSGSSAGMKNTIYSNNPNSTRMVFRAAIDDVPNPLISSFVKVDGDGMVQTLKFKPNDNLRFSVHLSNGDLYETLEAESVGPNQPNPEIQISCLFSIKRLGKLISLN